MSEHALQTSRAGRLLTHADHLGWSQHGRRRGRGNPRHHRSCAARAVHLRRVGAVRPDQVARIDAALITHLHYDHLDLPRSPVSAARPSSWSQPVRRRCSGVRASRRSPRSMSTTRSPSAVSAVRATFAAHGGNRPLFGARPPPSDAFSSRDPPAPTSPATPISSPEWPTSRGLDVALLPIWGWGPKLGPGHLDPRRAAEALVLLQPRIAVPIHWGTYYPIRLWGGGPSSSRGPSSHFAATRPSSPSVDVRIPVSAIPSSTDPCAAEPPVCDRSQRQRQPERDEAVGERCDGRRCPGHPRERACRSSPSTKPSPPGVSGIMPRKHATKYAIRTRAGLILAPTAPSAAISAR